MGMITNVLSLLFGDGRNVVQATAEVFRENATLAGRRNATIQALALRQHAAEFRAPTPSAFNRFMDGLNRLPRPALALGTLALFVAAMIDPVWFAARMQGIALVPEPLWWLLGVIVSFYFGARHQVKAQQFQRDIAESVARVPDVVENLDTLRAMRSDDVGRADTKGDAHLSAAAALPEANAALDAWRKSRRRSG